MKKEIGDKECLMQIEEFYEYVSDGAIMNYDGCGYYSKDGIHEEEGSIDLYDFEENYEEIKNVYPFVFWYNK